MVEAETADHCREEVVERTSREMHVLHETEEVKTRVPYGGDKSSLRTFALLAADGVSCNPRMSQLSLVWSEPPRCQRKVRK